MPYTVLITPRALRELGEALEWRRRQNRAAAFRWYQQILNAIRSLQENPQSCSMAPENDWYLGGELRQLLHGRRKAVYRLLFEIRGNTVFILRVRHGAQDLLGADDL